MKKIIVALSALALNSAATAQAFDSGVEIECVQANQPLTTTISLGKKLESSKIFASNYEAVVLTLHGPRLLGYDETTTVKKTPISTRIVAGIAYFAKLSDGTTLSLEDINFSSSPGLFPEAFTGTYTFSNGAAVPVNCQYTKAPAIPQY